MTEKEHNKHLDKIFEHFEGLNQTNMSKIPHVKPQFYAFIFEQAKEIASKYGI